MVGEIFHNRPDRPWGPPTLLYNGYRVSLPGVKRPGRGVDHPPPHLAPRLKKEYRFTSTPPPGLRGLFWVTFTFTFLNSVQTRNGDGKNSVVRAAFGKLNKLRSVLEKLFFSTCHCISINRSVFSGSNDNKNIHKTQ